MQTAVTTMRPGVCSFSVGGWPRLLLRRHRHHNWVPRSFAVCAKGRVPRTPGAPWIQFTGVSDSFTVEDNQNETGTLDDFMYRRYSTTQGRWISPDPAGLAAVDPTNPQTWNRYAYVTNQPLSFTDPLGLYLPVCPMSVIELGQCRWSYSSVVGWGSDFFDFMGSEGDWFSDWGAAFGSYSTGGWFGPGRSAANKGLQQSTGKTKTKAECQQLQAEIGSLNPVDTFVTDVGWGSLGAFGVGCIPGAILGGSTGSVIEPGGGTTVGLLGGCAVAGFGVLGEAGDAILFGAGAHAAYEYGEKSALQNQYNTGGCYLYE